MERYEALNVFARPVDMAIGGVMKAAKAVGAYEPVREWLYGRIKSGLLAGFKKKNNLEVIGLENVPPDSGAIIAANHQSWLDAQVLGSSSERDLHFIAKNDFVEWPVLSKFIELTESVYIRRGGDAEGLADVIERLKEGWLIAIFPEGTIAGEEETGRDQLDPRTGLLKGHSGMVRMAIAGGVPIIPVGISGTGQALPPEAYPRLEMPPLQKSIPVTIRYGKPIYFNGYSIDSIDRETLRRLTDDVMIEISKLVDHDRCFIPLEVPLKEPDTTGIVYYPETKKKAQFGVLVLHGFTSHLDCVRGIEPFVKELGIPYRFPILRGHGTVPHDLVGVTAQDWYDDAEAALNELLEHCEQVIVCGLSMGGLVALELGMNHKEEISNVVLIAPALKFADRLTTLTPLLSKMFKFWESPDSYNDAELEKERNRNYRIFATGSFASLYKYARKIEKRLDEFDRPVLILHSKKDKVIAPRAARIIYSKIATPSAQKKIVWFKRSGHEMCLDLEAEAVLRTIGDHIAQAVKDGQD
ncbi:MAG: alpha/beta fold hydrolase [bacterium]